MGRISGRSNIVLCTEFSQTYSMYGNLLFMLFWNKARNLLRTTRRPIQSFYTFFFMESIAQIMMITPSYSVDLIIIVRLHQYYLLFFILSAQLQTMLIVFCLQLFHYLQETSMQPCRNHTFPYTTFLHELCLDHGKMMI